MRIQLLPLLLCCRAAPCRLPGGRSTAGRLLHRSLLQRQCGLCRFLRSRRLRCGLRFLSQPFLQPSSRLDSTARPVLRFSSLKIRPATMAAQRPAPTVRSLFCLRGWRRLRRLRCFRRWRCRSRNQLRPAGCSGPISRTFRATCRRRKWLWPDRGDVAVSAVAG